MAERGAAAGGLGQRLKEGRASVSPQGLVFPVR